MAETKFEKLIRLLKDRQWDFDLQPGRLDVVIGNNCFLVREDDIDLLDCIIDTVEKW